MEYCVNLREFGLTRTQVKDISPLSGLTKLERLILGDNQVTDISPLLSLINLDYLWLYESQISDLSPLSSLTQLTELNLSFNQISDLSLLSSLTQLTELNLSFNQISDLSALLDNSGIGSGDTVDLRNNPLSDEALWEQIPALEERGVDVVLTPVQEERRLVLPVDGVLTRYEFTIRSQTYLDEFVSRVGSSFRMTGFLIVEESNLVSLEGLNGLTHIGGGLSILRNESLTSLEGLNNLIRIEGGLSIRGNESLMSLEGLNNLTHVGVTLLINNNDALTSLEGLNNLTRVGNSLSIYSNPSLTSLEGLNNLTHVEGNNLRITGNPVLPTRSAQAFADRLITGGFTGHVTIGGNQP